MQVEAIIRSMNCKVTGYADIIQKANGASVKNIYLEVRPAGRVTFSMPKYMKDSWNCRFISWEDAQKLLEEAFYQLKDRQWGIFDSGSYMLILSGVHRCTSARADLYVPEKDVWIRGFELSDTGSASLTGFRAPDGFNIFFNPYADQPAIRTAMNVSYRAYKKQHAAELYPAKKTEPGEKSSILPEAAAELVSLTQKEAVKKSERDRMGRIQHADCSPYQYMAHSVLRLDRGIEKESGSDALIHALSQGQKGGLGVTELSVLSWVARLRYCTVPMLLDLTAASYISRESRSNFDKGKLSSAILPRMVRYDLVDRSRITVMEEDGSLMEKPSDPRVYTLGRNGAMLLREMGEKGIEFAPFDCYQSGEVVKRYLAANQWLIYWLTHYSSQIGDNYQTARMVYRRGGDFAAAHIYASVELEGKCLVTEPVRRSDRSDRDHDCPDVEEKLTRLLSLFDHMEELYDKEGRKAFASRPILVFLMEDEEEDRHIHILYDKIRGILEENPRQEIWYTTDLRVFNQDVEHPFLRMTEEGLVPAGLE